MTIDSAEALSLKSDDDVCEITVHPTEVTHEISKLTMGCHSDTGYAHQARGLQSLA
eukprot:SAG11_NODE_14954_length_593_cov_1.904858_1_plen_56_part_00